MTSVLRAPDDAVALVTGNIPKARDLPKNMASTQKLGKMNLAPIHQPRSTSPEIRQGAYKRIGSSYIARSDSAQ